jgi:hypothetical protein
MRPSFRPAADQLETYVVVPEVLNCYNRWTVVYFWVPYQQRCFRCVIRTACIVTQYVICFKFSFLDIQIKLQYNILTNEEL